MISTTFAIIIAILIVLFLVNHFEIINIKEQTRPAWEPVYTTVRADLRGETGAQGIPGKDGLSIVGPMGPPGKDADINVLKTNVPWCANQYCKPPAGQPHIEDGPHRLKFDADKVIRHHGLDDRHAGMAIASGTFFATENLFTPKATISEGCLNLGNHSICSEGNTVAFRHNANGKPVRLYSDPSHSSIMTSRINNTDNWFGY